MATAVLARPPAMTSMAGVLTVLEETDDELRVIALQRLDAVVDQFWHEIADYLPDIESLYEEESFKGREQAALLASKVFYHLEQYEDALMMGLGAGALFDINLRTEYVEKVVAVAIDTYVKQRVRNFEADLKKEEPKEIDSRLEDVVNRMFNRCMDDKAYKQGLGMALECKRLDKIKDFITQSDDIPSTLEYCLKSAMTVITSKAFRDRVINLLVEIYTSNVSGVNYPALCQCYFILKEPVKVAEVLGTLLKRGDKEGRMIAFQIAFDIVDNESQHFCKTIMATPALKLPEPPAPAPAPAPAAPAEGEAAAPAEPAPAPVQDVPMEPVDDMSSEEKANLLQLRTILSGRSSIDLHLEFLYRNNRSDLLLLEIIKNSVDPKNSITHNGTVIAHGLMQCGTTSDVFLRKNLEWLAKATNWAKFSATASLGVIHKGHIKESRSILSTYLPAAGANRGSAYSEGGALYAMGIIHANHYDNDTKTYLLEQLQNAQSSEVLQHGACLGIGLVCMATADESIYEELKNTMYSDTAVAGEAAAYAIGLVMVGSRDQRVISDLMNYAHDTQHEKIIRAAALALAMTMFRQEQEAETLISEMVMEKDPILRYGGCFCIGLAYVGTAHQASIRRLLHISVSDVSDDVRRAAVMALGFVMCNVPDQLPGVVKLLSESYNPHVRYAAAMALGMACAGSANLEAHNLLQPLMSDPSDFVRQGAIIAQGLLYMQTAPGKTERVKDFREKIRKVIADKHEDVMTRFGAILASGIMDAGGRNCCASFFSHSGMLRSGASIGFCLFAQMWYWYPLIHMFSLTLTPTALIGLNERLKIPKNFSLKCGARPSLFAYPEPMQPPKKEEQAKAATAVLSTAAKAKASKDQKEKEAELKKGASGAALGADVDMDDKASATNSIAGGAAPSVTASVAATPGTTVVGSVSVAASDLASEQMEVDDQFVQESKLTSTDAKPGEEEKPAPGGESAAAADGDKAPAKKAEEDFKKNDAVVFCGPADAAKDQGLSVGRKGLVAECLEDGSYKVEWEADKYDGESMSTHVPRKWIKKEGDEKTSKKEPEPTEEILSNPCRVLPSQKAYISFPKEIEGVPVRYTPLLPQRTVGFLMLTDATPDEPEELFEDGKGGPGKEDPDEVEPEPPEPFEWTEADA